MCFLKKIITVEFCPVLSTKYYIINTIILCIVWCYTRRGHRNKSPNNRCLQFALLISYKLTIIRLCDVRRPRKVLKKSIVHKLTVKYISVA